MLFLSPRHARFLRPICLFGYSSRSYLLSVCLFCPPDFCRVHKMFTFDKKGYQNTHPIEEGCPWRAILRAQAEGGTDYEEYEPRDEPPLRAPPADQARKARACADRLIEKGSLQGALLLYPVWHTPCLLSSAGTQKRMLISAPFCGPISTVGNHAHKGDGRGYAHGNRGV